MKEWLKNCFYPNKCLLCRTILPKQIEGCLCAKCYHEVMRFHLCPRCGRPYDTGAENCLFCERDELSNIERLRAIFPYKEKCRKAVLRWKYRGIRKYARHYADLIVNDLCMFDELEIDALIPVPIAPNRARKRGFNQALDLAHELSSLTQIPVYDCLKRIKETKPQSKCSRKERQTNILDCIGLNPDIDVPELKKVAIIDDIYTTGATIKECIKVLQKELRIKSDMFFVIVVCIGI